jgi:hypothetical protein
VAQMGRDFFHCYLLGAQGLRLKEAKLVANMQWCILRKCRDDQVVTCSSVCEQS